MSIPLVAAEVLNREFLEIRAKLLEIAAALDRLDRAEGSVEGDARLAGIRRALAVLDEGGGARAERIQLIFSRAYDENWPTALGVPGEL
jgi:hypothetical protein